MYLYEKHVHFISIMLNSLEELTIVYFTYSRMEYLPRKNASLKNLLLSAQLIGSLEALLPDITSLTCLKITSCSVDDLLLKQCSHYPHCKY